jgi:hypothetical protein
MLFFSWQRFSFEVRAFRAFIYPDTAATTSVHFKLSSGIISTSFTRDYPRLPSKRVQF